MRSDNAESKLKSLVATARIGGLANIVAALRRALQADVCLFDATGNVLASSPSRALWSFDSLSRSGAETIDDGTSVREIRLEGTLVALFAVRSIDDPDGLVDVGVDLIVIELARLRSVQLARSESTTSLFDDVVRRRISDADAGTRLEGLGMLPGRSYRVLVGKSGDGATPRIPWSGLTTETNGAKSPFVTLVSGPFLVMIVPDDEMVGRISATLHRYLNETMPSADAAVGVGLPCATIGGLRASYFGALTAARSGAGVQIAARVDLGRLMVISNENLPLGQLADDLLAPLREHDRVHRGDLVATLRALLTHSRDIEATTRALYVHRNTLRYRRAKIEELLGVSLDDSTVITNLWLALHIQTEQPTGGTRGGDQ